MTARKKSTAKKTSRRFMRDDRKAVISVLSEVVAQLRWAADAKENGAFDMAVARGRIDTKAVENQALHAIGLRMAAHAVEERIGKLRKTWA